MSLYFKDKGTEKNSTSLTNVVILYVQINLVPFYFFFFFLSIYSCFFGRANGNRLSPEEEFLIITAQQY